MAKTKLGLFILFVKVYKIFSKSWRVIVGENLISSNRFLTETITEIPMTKIEGNINDDEEKKEEE